MYALQVNNLTKTYANGVEALKGISLNVEQGDFFALLGPNGAGKSTLIGIISSLVNASTGDVKVFDTSVQLQRSQAMSHIGLVPQELNFNQFEKPLEIIVNQAGYYGINRKVAHQRAEKYFRQLEFWDKRRSMARELSGGMKRRLMIARALIHEPRLLILDEPTAGVDIEIRRSMWDFLRTINQQGTTIILTTHYLEEAESLCKNIAIIDHGIAIENTSMRKLLAQLTMETFILYLDKHINDLPQCIPGCGLRIVDQQTLEVDVEKSNSINQVFKTLSEHNIQVLSMRNKSNRLEQLFMHLVDKNRSYQGTG